MKLKFLTLIAMVAAGTVSRDNENASSASPAENLHNTYAAIPEERQRRFWVRVFIGHSITGKMIC